VQEVFISFSLLDSRYSQSSTLPTTAHIQKALFSSRVKISPKPAEAAVAIRPRSLPTDIWTSLQKNHNPYQLSSISKVVSGSCKNNICLIQGPPGTGKSSTIVGIVSALLSGKAPLPGQRQSGCLIHPGKVSATSTFLHLVITFLVSWRMLRY
jgi:hypothetical protein